MLGCAIPFPLTIKPVLFNKTNATRKSRRKMPVPALPLSPSESGGKTAEGGKGQAFLSIIDSGLAFRPDGPSRKCPPQALFIVCCGPESPETAVAIISPIHITGTLAGNGRGCLALPLVSVITFTQVVDRRKRSSSEEGGPAYTIHSGVLSMQNVYENTQMYQSGVFDFSLISS